MENKLVIDIQLTKKDYSKFVLNNFGKKKIIFLFIVLGYILLSIAISAISGKTSYYSTYMYSILSTILLFVLIFKYATHVGFTKDPFLQKPQKLTFNSQGFTIETTDTVFKPEWQEIYKYKDYKDMFVIYLSPQRAALIPKRFLKLPEIETIQLLLSTKIDLNIPKKDRKKFIGWSVGIYILIIGIGVISGLWQSQNISEKDEADSYKYGGKYTEALELYNQLIETNKTSYELYVSRAECENKLGRYEEALNDCFAALDLNPEAGFAYYQLAIAQHLLGNDADACKSLNKATANGTYSTDEVKSEICY